MSDTRCSLIRSLYGFDLQQYRITAPFQADNSGMGTSGHRPGIPSGFLCRLRQVMPHVRTHHALVTDAKRKRKEASSTTPFTLVPVTATCAPLQQRDGGQVFGFKGLNLLEQILTGAFVGFTSLLHNQIVDFGVGVSVVHEVAVTEERRQIVIRVGVIREPAELVDRVGSIGILGNNTVFVVLESIRWTAGRP